MSKIPFIPLPFYKSYFRESMFKARHSHISSEDIAGVSLGKENLVGSASVIQVVYILYMIDVGFCFQYLSEGNGSTSIHPVLNATGTALKVYSMELWDISSSVW